MTISTIRDLLPLYALDLLEADEAAQVTAAVAADPKLAAELATYRDAVHQLAAAPTPVEPSPDVVAQLLASAGGGRFERFVARIAEVFDLAAERTRELLGLTERATSWEGPVPGIGLIHFDGGPACATADCGFVRISPGGTFPWHTHRGDELSIVVAGTLRDHDGKLYRAGDELFRPAGSQHELTAEGREDVIFIARAFDGIELGPRPPS
jgi:putative transcriptional regulator